MATGEPPWAAFKNQYSAMYQIANAKGPPPLPKGLLSSMAEDFIRKCCHPIQSKRWNVRRLLRHPFIKGGKKETAYKKPDSIVDEDEFVTAEGDE